MSTGLNCMFVEVKEGEWYYVLEKGSAPKMAWDWREYADCFGPFPTEDAAREHLGRHHANPGGSDRVSKEEFRPDEVMSRLIAEAPENVARFKRTRYGPFYFPDW